ncbi:hypothetical protein [Spongiactinospora sp. TRM90649]|uniref:hypothetical protein n=1 Tax=Spongiactinospora sp. TRM90649 TaxID=3031114 RepID=UPI0023F8D952|nr:hypothetical protein [Spongiactinospora sp. TRM90649]
MLDPTGPIARQFPLIARTRPACTPLPQRVADLTDRARAVGQAGDMAGAAAVCNLAALLASDLGLPDLARRWCLRQSNVYLSARPLGTQAARHALEPLINIARLHMRAGDGERAFNFLDAMYTAICNRTDTIIDGIDIPGATLSITNEDHQDLRRWLWANTLAAGARALAIAGRWEEAHTQLRRYKGIGRRMLDGRQVAILAHATSGDTTGALALLDDTQPGEPWENAVTACLSALCRGCTGQLGDQNSTLLIDRYQLLPPIPGLDVFHTRLGLTIIDTLGGTTSPSARQIALDLIDHTIAASDGYTARELLSHTDCASLLTPSQSRDLTAVVIACALGTHDLPADLRTDLETALATSETELTRALTPLGGA